MVVELTWEPPEPRRLCMEVSFKQRQAEKDASRGTCPVDLPCGPALWVQVLSWGGPSMLLVNYLCPGEGGIATI